MFAFLIVLVALALLATGVVVAGGVAGWRWSRRVQQIEARILGGRRSPGAPALASPLDTLPPPVRRFAARSIPETATGIVAARLIQEGTFQMGEGPDGWRRFEAVEVFRGHPPAFFWDARIAMAPAIPVRVLDAYVDGEARMVGKILGLVTVVDAAPDPGLRKGALARYLAEAVWMPTRLVSGPGLTWKGIDDDTAEATLRDGDSVVSLRFTFDTSGDPIGVEGIRGREVEGAYVDTLWRGRFTEHREMDGFRIPTRGEVAWVIGGVETPYWRGTITAAEFTTR